MSSNSRIEPGGSVAEALTNVVAPDARIGTVGEAAFFYCRGLAQLSPSAFFPFEHEQQLETTASPIIQSGPHEMKEFMYKYQAKQGGIQNKCLVQDNPARSNKTRGVNRGTPVRGAGQELTAKDGQFGLYRDTYRATR
jgi:hypothetical protein